MPELSTQARLDYTIDVSRPIFRKDSNFVVTLDPYTDIPKPGDAITITTDGEFAAAGTITHTVVSSILDIPKFVFDKMHDPMYKNPIALYHRLGRQSGDRLIMPTELVLSIGFTVVTKADGK